jgi:hypothetical protein
LKQHREDIAGSVIAEELAELLFVVGDAVLLNQGDKVGRGITGESRFGKVGVGGEKVLGPGVKIGEIAATAPGDQNLTAGFGTVFEDNDSTAEAGGFGGVEQTRRATPDDDGVKS